MSNYDSLQQVFLIAMPQIKGPFSQSVIYLWEYNEHGAKGLIINKPMKASLGDLLRHLEIPIQDQSKRVETHPILMGGPSATHQGFIIQRQRAIDFETGEPELSIEIYVDRDALTPLAEGERLADTLVATGYAQWKAGQLDMELKNNDWLVAPFNENTLFCVLEDPAPTAPPEHNMACGWRSAVATMGINLHDLSLKAGHA